MIGRAIFVIVAVAWLAGGPGAAITEAQCTDNLACGIAKYCRKAPGDCDGQGDCSDKPLACPDVWDPVCGCDGTTYGNSCEAAAAGINVSTEGECPSPACDSNAECGAGEYCLKSTGDCDGEGVCSAQPLACPDVWDPVCGCDDTTYGNSCEAALVGINVSSEGECPAPSCQNNDSCASGMFCLKDSGDCLGDGECSEQPTLCLPTWDPVCGCDDITYANQCMANQAGNSVAYDGECQTSCETGNDCLQTEYCDTAHNGCWQTGACRIRPIVCTEQYDPVCGCNELTFDNACYAAFNGATVVKLGVCGACPYIFSRTCIFTDAYESGGTGRWSGVVGD